MLKELRSSQLIQYKKLLKTVLEGIDSAISIRQGLIEYDSASQYEKAVYDCNNDPEPYYHLKMFDMAIGLIRLYNPREWSIDDPDEKYFHFTIRLYNFVPKYTYKLKIKTYVNYSDYGEFLDLNDCMSYMFRFIVQMFSKRLKSAQDSLFLGDIF